MSTPTFCSLAWNHLRLTPDGSYSPCCNYLGNSEISPDQDSIESIIHSPLFQKIRNQMANGEKVNGCKKCYETELSSGESMRTNANKEFQFSPRNEVELKYLELFVGNLCNLKCLGCNSLSSSRWKSDEKKLDPKRNHPAPPTVPDISNKTLSTLEKIKIIGGEPFLYKEHEKLLERLSAINDLKKLSLEYPTNGTIRVPAQTLNIWKKCKKIELTFSIDGLREKNDRFREGSKWQEIFENIHWYMDQMGHSNIEYNFHTVVNIYNIDDIFEIDEWLLHSFPKSWLTKDCLLEPRWLDARNLPMNKRKKLAEKFMRLAQIPELKNGRRKSYKIISGHLRSEQLPDLNLFLNEEKKIKELCHRVLDKAPISEI